MRAKISEKQKARGRTGGPNWPAAQPRRRRGSSRQAIEEAPTTTRTASEIEFPIRRSTTRIGEILKFVPGKRGSAAVAAIRRGCGWCRGVRLRDAPTTAGIRGKQDEEHKIAPNDHRTGLEKPSTWSRRPRRASRSSGSQRSQRTLCAS